MGKNFIFIYKIVFDYKLQSRKFFSNKNFYIKFYIKLWISVTFLSTNQRFFAYFS